MRLFVCFIFILLSFNAINGQCPPGDLLIDTEEKALLFQKEYPGCTIIQGNLIIGPKDGLGTTRTERVIGLSKIIEVTGNVTIQNNPWLQSAPDVLNIKKVGGDFVIDSNEELQGAFPTSLISVGGKLRFAASYNQNIYPSFKTLTDVGKNLEFYSKQGRWSYFPNLERVGGNINIYDQPGYITALDDFHELREVKQVSFHLHNRDLTINAFGKLKKIESISLELKTDGLVNLGPTIPVDYVTIYETSAHLIIPAFKGITSLKSLNLYSMGGNGMRHFPDLKKVDFLLLSDPFTKWTSFPDIVNTPVLDSVGTAILHGQCLHFIPFLPLITKKLQLRGRLDNELLTLVDQCKEVKKVSINSSYIPEINHPFSIKTDVFALEHLSALTSLKNWDISNMEVGEIRIENTKISTLDDIKGALMDSSILVLKDNVKLTECAYTNLLCKWLETDLDGKSNILFRGKNGTCSEEGLKEKCEK